MESNCDVICLQETKRQDFDLNFLKKICPPIFDALEFIPFVGASRGSLFAWKSCFFSGSKIFQNDFCLSVEFVSKHNDEHWILSNIYAPCTAPSKCFFCSGFRISKCLTLSIG